MFLIPVGIEGHSLRRMPYVSLTIAVLCGVAFFATWVVPRDPYGDSQTKLDELTAYWVEHPNARFPESALARYPKSVQTELLEHHRTQLEERGPASDVVNAELSRRADEIIYAKESALVKFSLKYGKGLKQIGLLTHMFLHLGWMHLIFNLLFFYMTGPLLEDVWGRPFFAGFYVAGGLASVVAEFSLSNQQTGFSVGASGAIAACMGAFAVRYATATVRMAYLFFTTRGVLRGFFRWPAWLAGLLWVLSEVWSLLLQTTSGVAVLAHIGGFGFGVAFALTMKAVGFEKKFLEEGVENADVVYARPVELDAAHEAFAKGDYANARKSVNELLKKTPELMEAEVLLYRIEKRQNLGNAASARLDRLINRALGKEDAQVFALLADLGDDFDPKTVRAVTATRLLPKLEVSDQVNRRFLSELLDVASTAPGLPGARMLLRQAEEALNDGAPDRTRSFIEAAKQRAPDAPELVEKIETLERRLMAEASTRGSVAENAVASAAPRFRSATVVGSDDQGLSLEANGKVAKLPWTKIQAVAAALAPSGVASADGQARYVPVTDLVLGWGNALEGADVLRINAPSLGLSVLFPGVPPQQAYAQWLKNAIERSGASVLPDKDAVLSGKYTRYGSVDEMTAALYSVQI